MTTTEKTPREEAQRNQLAHGASKGPRRWARRLVAPHRAAGSSAELGAGAGASDAKRQHRKLHARMDRQERQQRDLAPSAPGAAAPLAARSTRALELRFPRVGGVGVEPGALGRAGPDARAASHLGVQGKEEAGRRRSLRRALVGKRRPSPRSMPIVKKAPAPPPVSQHPRLTGSANAASRLRATSWDKDTRDVRLQSLVSRLAAPKMEHAERTCMAARPSRSPSELLRTPEERAIWMRWHKAPPPRQPRAPPKRQPTAPKDSDGDTDSESESEETTTSADGSSTRSGTRDSGKKKQTPEQRIAALQSHNVTQQTKPPADSLRALLGTSMNQKSWMAEPPSQGATHLARITTATRATTRARHPATACLVRPPSAHTGAYFAGTPPVEVSGEKPGANSLRPSSTTGSTRVSRAKSSSTGKTRLSSASSGRQVSSLSSPAHGRPKVSSAGSRRSSSKRSKGRSHSSTASSVDNSEISSLTTPSSTKITSTVSSRLRYLLSRRLPLTGPSRASGRAAIRQWSTRTSTTAGKAANTACAVATSPASASLRTAFGDAPWMAGAPGGRDKLASMWATTEAMLREGGPWRAARATSASLTRAAGASMTSGGRTSALGASPPEPARLRAPAAAPAHGSTATDGVLRARPVAAPAVLHPHDSGAAATPAGFLKASARADPLPRSFPATPPPRDALVQVASAVPPPPPCSASPSLPNDIAASAGTVQTTSTKSPELYSNPTHFLPTKLSNTPQRYLGNNWASSATARSLTDPVLPTSFSPPTPQGQIAQSSPKLPPSLNDDSSSKHPITSKVIWLATTLQPNPPVSTTARNQCFFAAPPYHPKPATIPETSDAPPPPQSQASLPATVSASSRLPPEGGVVSPRESSCTLPPPRRTVAGAPRLAGARERFTAVTSAVPALPTASFVVGPPAPPPPTPHPDPAHTTIQTIKPPSELYLKNVSSEDEIPEQTSPALNRPQASVCRGHHPRLIRDWRDGVRPAPRPPKSPFVPTGNERGALRRLVLGPQTARGAAGRGSTARPERRPPPPPPPPAAQPPSAAAPPRMEQPELLSESSPRSRSVRSRRGEGRRRDNSEGLK